MKRLSIWSRLILIASVLLLSAARNVAAKSPSQPNQGSQTKTAAEKHASVTSPSPTLFNQPRTAPTSAQNATYINNRYRQTSPWGDFPAWLEAIATLGLLAYAACQMSFVRRSTEAAEKAADAARDALRATEKYEQLALNAEKPYVFVIPQRIDERTETVPDYIGALLPGSLLTKKRVARWVDIDLRNVGKGVAVIDEIYVRQCVAARENWQIAKGERVSVLTPVLGPNDLTKCGTYVAERLSRPLYEDIRRRYAIIGFVRYRDVYDRRFRSTFGYYYRPSSILTPILAFFFRAAPKHNRIYEEKDNAHLSKPE